MRLSVLAVATLAALPVVAQPPAPLGDLVLGLRSRPSEALDAGFAGRALRDGTGNPQLIWSELAGRTVPLRHSKDEILSWLSAMGAALGHGSLDHRFAQASQWRGLEVWHFELVRDGVVLFDAETCLYWQGDRCLGITNRCPKLGPIPTLPAERDGIVLYALPGHSGTIVVAELRVSLDATHRTMEIVHAGKVVHRMLQQRNWATASPTATITEYTPPGAVFPDQIWADSKGLIWFSDPNANAIVVYDPTANSFKSHPTTGYTLPDGLSVDDKDRVWTGLYGVNNGLGMLDAVTRTFVRYPPPSYTNAQLAIPTPTGRGTILVTDHFAERVSEFDPKTATWLRSEVLPPASYPVGAALEPETDDGYFPLYSYHGLARLTPTGPITRIAAPSLSGPAFAGVHDGKVYFTYWSANKLGEYDTKTNTFVEYLWRAGELGGPMAMAPNGCPVIGTRSRGYIAIFDPLTKTFTDHLIPTTSPGLKDGLTVAPDGVIWFTESGARKIAKLVLP